MKKQLRKERQSYLLEGWKFTCNCVSCLEDWPTLKKLSNDLKFCCPVCSSGLGVEERRKDEFLKIKLTSSNKFNCASCGRKYSKKELKEKLSQHQESLEVASKLIESGSPLTFIESLKEACQFFQYHLIPPSKDQIKCEALLEKAFWDSIVDEE